MRQCSTDFGSRRLLRARETSASTKMSDRERERTRSYSLPRNISMVSFLLGKDSRRNCVCSSASEFSAATGRWVSRARFLSLALTTSVGDHGKPCGTGKGSWPSQRNLDLFSHLSANWNRAWLPLARQTRSRRAVLGSLPRERWRDCRAL